MGFQAFALSSPDYPQNLVGESAISGEFIEEDLGIRLAQGNDVRISEASQKRERQKRGASDLRSLGGQTARGVISATNLVKPYSHASLGVGAGRDEKKPMEKCGRHPL